MVIYPWCELWGAGRLGHVLRHPQAVVANAIHIYTCYCVFVVLCSGRDCGAPVEVHLENMDVCLSDAHGDHSCSCTVWGWDLGSSLGARLVPDGAGLRQTLQAVAHYLV